ncbi:MAG: hypothetical protein ACLFP8_07300 [Alphaproteobacteria bacterium]
MTDNYDNFDKIPDDEGKKDKQIATLQTQLEEVKEERHEERFCWALSLLILLNVFFFTNMEGWGAPISILLLQLVLLIILARKWGVEDLTDILDKYILNLPANPLCKKKTMTEEMNVEDR